MKRVGVLLNSDVLRKNITGANVFEKGALYIKAARKFDIDVVFFDAAGIRLRNKQVKGYVPNRHGRLRPRVLAWPKAVHNRALYFRRGRVSQRRVQRMIRRGVHVFNPPVRFDKYTIHNMLSTDETVQPYLPNTVLLHPSNEQWFQYQLESRGDIYVKPRQGSLGRGIMRIQSIGGDLYRTHTRKRRYDGTWYDTWRFVLRYAHPRSLLQVGIDLTTYKGRRFDLRVPVQRGGDGAWTVPGMVAKCAGDVQFLTNVARGGTSRNVDEIFSHLFLKQKERAVREDIHRMALAVAERMGEHIPGLADIGLDIGIEPSGKPYLIEVNRRDLRITFLQSGDHDILEQLYENPMAYGAYLLRKEVTV